MREFRSKSEALEFFDRWNQTEQFAIVLEQLDRLAVKQGLLLETGAERIDRIQAEGGDSFRGMEVLSEEGWQDLKDEWLAVFKLSAGAPRFRELFVELVAEIHAD